MGRAEGVRGLGVRPVPQIATPDMGKRFRATHTDLQKKEPTVRAKRSPGLAEDQ
jgi:hypothetical protein